MLTVEDGRLTLAKVGHFAALGQEKKRIESVEEHSRRLVDGALSCMSTFAHSQDEGNVLTRTACPLLTSFRRNRMML